MLSMITLPEEIGRTLQMLHCQRNTPTHFSLLFTSDSQPSTAQPRTFAAVDLPFEVLGISRKVMLREVLFGEARY